MQGSRLIDELLGKPVMLLSNTPMRRGCLQKADTVAHARARFNKCLHVGDNIDEVDARLLQGIIPDAVIDARDCDAGPFPTSNPLVGCKTLVEHKTLASLLVSVRARAKKV